MATPEASALIQQISALIQQYLALPEDTPLKATFQDVLPEVQAAAGGGGDLGSMPLGQGDLGGGAPPMMNGQGAAPETADILNDETGEPAAAQDEGSSEPARDFKSARKGATAMLEGRNAKASQEEQRRKKNK